MAKITVNEDCDNAPKKKYILDFLVASADADIGTALEMVSDDIQLELVGRKSIRGKNAFKEIFIEDSSRSKVAELIIANILSHGRQCAANGTIIFDDGGKVAFNNVYTFSGFGNNAKLELIEVYSIILSE